MACNLMVPSHFLNQRCLIISEALLHSPKGNFIGKDIFDMSVEITNSRLKSHNSGGDELGKLTGITI